MQGLLQKVGRYKEGEESAWMEWVGHLVVSWVGYKVWFLPLRWRFDIGLNLIGGDFGNLL